MYKFSKFAAVAAFGVAASVIPAFAVDQVVIDLAGIEVKHGKASGNVAPDPIDEAITYKYSITGTVDGTGDFNSAVPSGTSIAALLEEIEPGSSENLTGDFFNLSGNFPVTVYKNKLSGKVNFGGQKVSGKAKLTAAISDTGFAAFSVTGVSFKIGQFPLSGGSIVFEAGSKLTLTADDAPSGSPQPDLVALSSSTSGRGNNVYNTTGANQSFEVQLKKKKAKSFLIMLTNDGPNTDSFGVQLVPADDDSTVKVFDGNTDITTLIVDGEYTADSLPSGGVKILKVKVTPKKSAEEAKTIAVTATSLANTSAQDRVNITYSVK